VSGSALTLPLRLSLRTARAALRTTRNAAETGLSVLELIGDVLERPSMSDAGEPVPYEPVVTEPVVTDTANGRATSVYDEPAPLTDPVPHVDAEAEVVEEVAEPGAEDGAGAQIRVDAPFAGYDALRAADVAARLRGADVALLGAIELYEHTHRRRRTVLEAVARELRRPRDI
jgi:hypothetical protein